MSRRVRHARKVLDMVGEGQLAHTVRRTRPAPNPKLRYDIDIRDATAARKGWFYLGSKDDLEGAEAAARKALDEQRFTHARIVDARTAAVVKEFIAPKKRRADGRERRERASASEHATFEFSEARDLPKPPRDPGRWYKGWPVPWTIHWPGFPKGTPDWTTADNDRVAGCLDRGLCGVCGQEIEGDAVAFVGGAHGRDLEEAAKEGVPFYDPAMHVECAEYSAKVCPYLGGGRVRENMSDSGVQYIWYGRGVVRLDRTHSTFHELDRVALIDKEARR